MGKPDIVAESGKEMRFGDLGVTVTGARVMSFRSIRPSGGELVHGSELCVGITFKNYDTTRIAHAQSQIGHCSLTDDVGNKYSLVTAKTDAGFRAAIQGQIPQDMEIDVRSEMTGQDLLVFSKPVEGASSVTLTLDASRYGGQGLIEVTFPKSMYKPF